jgi:hypothetical protein
VILLGVHDGVAGADRRYLVGVECQVTIAPIGWREHSFFRTIDAAAE